MGMKGITNFSWFHEKLNGIFSQYSVAIVCYLPKSKITFIK